ncbi:MAG: Helix-turn-helix domain [Actinomycetota bacterium]|nr:Helix-turn-helix domain [Actinomycetota bacterium]
MNHDTGTQQQDLYTYEQAAEYLKMSKRQLQRHVRDGEVGYIKRGRWVVFARDDLMEFASAWRVAPIPADERSAAQKSQPSPAPYPPHDDECDEDEWFYDLNRYEPASGRRRRS